MMGGHALMFLTMLGAMLLRRHDYTHHHGTWPWRRRVVAHVAGGAEEAAEDPRVAARSR